MERIFQHALDRRKAGGAGDKNNRSLGIFAQIKRSQRAFAAQDIPHFHRVENVGRECAPRNELDVPFDQLCLMRCSGKGKCAPLPVLEHNINVLPGMKPERFDIQGFQHHPHDIHRQQFQFCDARHESSNRDIAHGANAFTFEFQIGQRRGAAHQDLARTPLIVCQRALLINAIVHASLQNSALAHAATARAAFKG